MASDDALLCVAEPKAQPDNLEDQVTAGAILRKIDSDESSDLKASPEFSCLPQKEEGAANYSDQGAVEFQMTSD